MTDTVPPAADDPEKPNLAATVFRSLAKMGSIWSLVPLAVVVLVLLMIFGGDIAQLYRSALPGKPGIIILDSPEVYTRERLINDRLEEHLWLTTQLDGATNTDRIFDGYVSRARVVNIGSGDAAAAGASVPEAEGQAASTIAFDEEFRLRSAVRDQIRQRILENQLDDRHDLYGNSLYILKFDATIVPASYSDSRAYIRVAIGIPSMYAAVRQQGGLTAGAARRPSASAEAATYFREGSATLQEWLDLFERWRLDLATRLDESVSKESEGFSLKRWKAADYEELRSYIRSRLAARQDWPPALLDIWTESVDSKDKLQALIGRSDAYGADFSKLVAEFFGDRALKLVLGIQIGANSYDENQIRWAADQLLYSVDPLSQYVDIHMRPPVNLGDAPDFNVEMRWDRVHVTDEKCRQATPAKPDPANAPSGQADPGSAMKISMVDRWDNPTRNVFSETYPQYRLTPDLYLTMQQSKLGIISLPPAYYESLGLTGCSIVELVSLPSGLFNFIEKIARADLYSYAVLPRQSVRATVTEILNRVGVSGLDIGSIPEGGKVSVGAGTEEQRSGASLRATVTSFAATGRYGAEPEEKPEFGWIIAPNSSALSAVDARPVSESMMAIVSVPAWWEELHLSVETGWINEDGDWVQTSPDSARWRETPAAADADGAQASGQADGARRQTLSVVLPNSYEGIDAFLMQVKRRKPVIVESDFEQDELSACAPASLLIRGNRLWRNSVVTLGSQEATSIKVMPNMDGILATFRRVEIPSSLTGNAGLVKLRVWTSEGMAELRQDVRIVVPSTINDSDRALRNCGSLGNEALSSSAKAN